MALQIAVFHRLDDPNDPNRWGCGNDEQKFFKTIVARHREWLSRQEPVHQARFCKHGSYVGYQRSLAYLCPRCPEQ